MFKLLKFVLILAVIAAVAGYFLDWYEVDKEGDKWSVTVDKDKLKEDARKAKELGKDAANKIKETFDGEKAEGTLEGVDVPAGTVAVKTEGGERLDLKMDEKIVIEIDKEKSRVESLNRGERISVYYDEKDGVKTATRIRAERK